MFYLFYLDYFGTKNKIITYDKLKGNAHPTYIIHL
jgi:hypothetical protein